MYVLKDKKTGGKRGAAFVKYKLQSQAAKAKEECDESKPEIVRLKQLVRLVD